MQKQLRVGMILSLILSFCLAILLSLIFGKQVQSQGDDLTDSYYDSEGKRVTVRINPRQLGVVGREGVESRQLEQALRASGLRLLRRYPGNLLIFGFERAQKRNELAKLARDLKARNAQLIAQAGLSLAVGASNTPVVATDEFIAKFKANVSPDQIATLHRENAVERVMENPFVKGQFLLRVTSASRLDVLQMALRYRNSGLTDYAYPNFINVTTDLETIPNDALFGNQWHHRNTGQNGGTPDADADTSLAWDITLGNATTIIAVIENGGFDMAHPDLTPNLWVNPGETAGNGIDDDGNGFVDDVNGWDFVGCSSPTTSGCGDNNPSPASATTEDHGTAVAGVAAARGNNLIGVTGGCPNCSLMLLRTGYTSSDWAKSLAFGYAQNRGAQIITNSWGGGGALPNTTAAINTAATTGRGGLGTLIFFAMGNTNANVCTGPSLNPMSSLPNVIGVSSSSNQDRKVAVAGFGNCVDILAPSHRGYSTTDPLTGTLHITTTDRTAGAGYNNTNPPPLDVTGLAESADNNYTNFFGGTSSASPLAASIAALMLTVNPSLTRQQAQNLIQDTADKIEDSVANYSPANGFSAPSGGGAATHSWGRINAFEAVRIAAPTTQGGKGGVDIFLRDNRLDWGNTEQPSNTLFEPTRGFIPHWHSVDIKVDAPPYQPAPTNNASFEAFVHENAESGDLNKVYVRVRNRGPVTAGSVTVKLHWAYAGAGLPGLPNDFWSAFPGNSSVTSIWHPLGVQPITNLAYSGSSVANTGGDAAQVVAFDFPGPPLGAGADPNHFCLFAVLDSLQDRVFPPSRLVTPSDLIPDALTPTDNNVTHRNIRVEDTMTLSEFTERFFVSNPTREQARIFLRLQAPKRWEVSMDRFKFNEAFSLKPNEKMLVKLTVRLPNRRASGELSILQETYVGDKKIVGGMTYRFARARHVPNGH